MFLDGASVMVGALSVGVERGVGGRGRGASLGRGRRAKHALGFP